MRLLLTLGGSLLAGATPFAASAALQPSASRPAALHEAATSPSVAAFAASRQRVVAAAQDRDRREDEIDELRRMIDELRAEKDRLREEIDAERADARPKREIVVRRVGAGDRDTEDARTRREVEIEARRRAERGAKELAKRAEEMERIEVELRDAQHALHAAKLPAIALRNELEALQQDLGAELDAEFGEFEFELAELDFDVLYQDANLPEAQDEAAQQRVREVYERAIEESLRGYVENLRTHEVSADQLRALLARAAESHGEGAAAGEPQDVRWFEEGDDERFHRTIVEGIRKSAQSGDGAPSHHVRWFAEGEDEEFYREIVEGARAGAESDDEGRSHHVRWFAEGEDEEFYRKIVEGAQGGDDASVELRFGRAGGAARPEEVHEYVEIAEWPDALHEIVEDADGNVEIHRRVIVRGADPRADDGSPFGIAVVREKDESTSTNSFFRRRGHDADDRGHDVWVEVDGEVHRVHTNRSGDEPRVESRVFFRGADGELHEIDAGPGGGVLRVLSSDGSGTSHFRVFPEAPKAPRAPDAPRPGTSSTFGVTRPAPPSPATGGVGVSRAPRVDTHWGDSPGDRDAILREVHDLTREMLGELRDLRAAVEDLRRDVDARHAPAATGAGTRRHQ